MVGLSGSHILVSQTAKSIWMIPSFDNEGRSSIAGPGLSATCQWVCRHLESLWPLGSHSMAVSKAPKCGMLDPLYAVSLVSQGDRPVGLLVVVICLGNNLAKAWSGITLPPAPVNTLHLRLPHFFCPTSAGRLTVSQA